MYVAGIDVSTYAVDLVLIPTDLAPPIWNRYPLKGPDAWERTRNIARAMPSPYARMWDDIEAIGVENPAGKHGIHTVQRAVGAVLACLPPSALVQPWRPAEWRKAVDLPGNASKTTVLEHGIEVARGMGAEWAADTHPQDCFDALCIALATVFALNEHNPQTVQS